MDLTRRRFTIDVAGKEAAIEVSGIAGQATSSVIGHYGNTSALVTVVMGERDVEKDYFPLVVDYEERFYAVGKILGSRFVRREGRPSEEAILSGRIIDRTIRPLFNQRMRREVQVVLTVLQADEESELDFITLLSASVALSISEIPWAGPVAGVRMLFDGAGVVLCPPATEIKACWGKEGVFLSFAAGTKDRINMVELEGIDAQERPILDAFSRAQKEIAALAAWQEKIVKEIGRPKITVKLADMPADLKKAAEKFVHGKLETALYTKDKTKSQKLLRELEESLIDHLKTAGLPAAAGAAEEALAAVPHLLEELTDELLHEKVLAEGVRPDGRALDQVRDLYAEVGFLKRTHGSALFARGTTQALVVTTIAPPGSEQLIETMEFTGKRRFLLHYNFPPYSVGEVGRIGAPGRREIGHGALAEKAVRNLIPPQEEFPYTIRAVSEILSSNGSSSMATVCGTSLSLMDAGVPIKKAVAVIAMGLITGAKGEYKVLTDIQGPEDHFGDMDFKIAGAADGIRAMQLDVKIDGLTNDMIAATIKQARKAHETILGAMNKALPAARKELSPLAPLVLSLKIDPSRIGELIGPGGKVINGIIERTGALAIDVEQDGRVYVAGASKAIAEAAFAAVSEIFKEYQPGDIIEGRVAKILEFGAIVEFGGRDGMIHVSELRDGFVKKVEDVVRLGDVVKAKVLRVDPTGKIALSIKALTGKK